MILPESVAESEFRRGLMKLGGLKGHLIYDFIKINTLEKDPLDIVGVKFFIVPC